MYRDLLIELRKPNVHPSKIEVKLESAYKIWEVDFASITSQWTHDVTKIPLKISSITNERGEDVRDILAFKDSNYLINEEGGHYIDLHCSAPEDLSESTLVLQGNGYFHKKVNIDKKLNWPFFIGFRKANGLERLSRTMHTYMQLYTHNVNSEVVTSAY